MVMGAGRGRNGGISCSSAASRCSPFILASACSGANANWPSLLPALRGISVTFRHAKRRFKNPTNSPGRYIPFQDDFRLQHNSTEVIVDAIYFCTITMTTVGFGDIIPVRAQSSPQL